ncbi:hypothetical protein FOA43_002566 [Brettanomyces nanus]|uniref:Major facilitator superfamily (MFS) profile domain-containing protein n=1 Tax=Eeniella nana TaxID=13502 RepID=A0A875S1G6_EENNA|nr:uncharacterized protein FOA43_002566 [Brettanomyces nanus]QPG75216.1 hypothetical protein FOA43_002566 [Brettanomyces nanus]
MGTTLGIFMGYCVCYGSYHNYSDARQWRIPVGLSFAWAIISMFGTILAPESPRFLVQKGKIEMAKESIAKINRAQNNSTIVLDELNNLMEAIELENQTGKPNWKEFFTGKPKIFFRVTMGVVLDSLQQLTGNTYFFYYATSTFKSVGLTDGFMTSIILGVDNFASTFVALYIIDHLGRRKTLMSGSAGMLACMAAYSILGVVALYPKEYGVDPKKPIGDAMIFFCCLFIFFFATTWGPGVYVIVGESYPLRIRADAIAIATAGNWIWGFLIAFFTPIITNVIHFAYGFVFVGTAAFELVFVFTCVPETKGMCLEDVDELYEHFTPGLAFRTKQTAKNNT